MSYTERPIFFKLGPNREPVPCRPEEAESLLGSASPRTVACDVVGEATVSTVFLTIDHSRGVGEPVLFETMVFGGAMDAEQNRYCTWAEAEAGHAAILARVRAAEAP